VPPTYSKMDVDVSGTDVMVDYGKCTSDRDLVSLVDWIDSKPTVFINFIDDENRKGRFNCYDGDSLSYWLKMNENTFAMWKGDQDMDDMGYGGSPDLSNKFFKLYTGEFVRVDNLSNRIKRGLKDSLGNPIPVVFDATLENIIRIGNTRGSFGVSEVHGQLPGYRVYKLHTKHVFDDANRDNITEDDMDVVSPGPVEDDMDIIRGYQDSDSDDEPRFEFGPWTPRAPLATPPRGKAKMAKMRDYIPHDDSSSEESDDDIHIVRAPPKAKAKGKGFAAKANGFARGPINFDISSDEESDDDMDIVRAPAKAKAKIPPKAKAPVPKGKGKGKAPAPKGKARGYVDDILDYFTFMND
jgi:hypothetical protein